jgi:hypothetical protein
VERGIGKDSCGKSILIERDRLVFTIRFNPLMCLILDTRQWSRRGNDGCPIVDTGVYDWTLMSTIGHLAGGRIHVRRSLARGF